MGRSSYGPTAESRPAPAPVPARAARARRRPAAGPAPGRPDPGPAPRSARRRRPRPRSRPAGGRPVEEHLPTRARARRPGCGCAPGCTVRSCRARPPDRVDGQADRDHEGHEDEEEDGPAYGRRVPPELEGDLRGAAKAVDGGPGAGDAAALPPGAADPGIYGRDGVVPQDVRPLTPAQDRSRGPGPRRRGPGARAGGLLTVLVQRGRGSGGHLRGRRLEASDDRPGGRGLFGSGRPTRHGRTAPAAFSSMVSRPAGGGHRPGCRFPGLCARLPCSRPVRHPLAQGGPSSPRPAPQRGSLDKPGSGPLAVPDPGLSGGRGCPSVLPLVHAASK